MSISNEVNIDVLNEVYALSAFHGLRAADPNDQWNNQTADENDDCLPDSHTFTHGDTLYHDDETNDHLKINPALEAMERAVGKTSGTIDSNDMPHQSSIHPVTVDGIESHHKQMKSHTGQLDHPSLTSSDYLNTPASKSMDDLTASHE
jgi:hypothetical protein